MKMISTGPPIPVPNHNAANGTQAIGATKRTASNAGVTMRSIHLNQAISRPSGMPISTARPKPMPKRCRLDNRCSCSR